MISDKELRQMKAESLNELYGDNPQERKPLDYTKPHTWQDILLDVKRQEYEFGKSINFEYIEVIK